MSECPKDVFALVIAIVRDVSTAAGDRHGFPRHQISPGLRDWERKRRRGSPRARALSVRWGKLAVLALSRP